MTNSALHLQPFRAALQDHGLLLPDAQLDEESRPREKWRYAHLVAMAMLACRVDPDLVVDGTLTPAALYAALDRAIPLAESVVPDLDELLEQLALLEGKGSTAPELTLEENAPPRVTPWKAARKSPQELTDAELDTYTEMILDALQAAAEARPWRVGRSHATFTRDYVVGNARDLFAGSQPGVMPAFDDWAEE